MVFRQCRLLAGTFGIIAAGLLTGCNAIPEKDAEPDTERWAPRMPVPKTEALPVVHGSLFNPAYSRNLFEDRMAFRIGDILTVRLDEKTSSRKSSGTTMDKNSSASMPNPILFGSLKELNVEAGMDRAFEGSTGSTMDNSLSGDITVTVAEVFSNGALHIIGEKWLRLNQGDEYIRIEGMVRPEDISPDNVVMSMRLANARIMYSGSGPLNDANDAGWLTKFFNSPIMPM
ncbi:flagellar basal body L-ring protein FlgH [Parendozoicomonas haliclonae]|uniref:Flagellar L-ring protein n=1 Tax=Parendozoicomonas haliclonae TaxID=1960125 RepID=A0A1X7AMZ3_9GAMM|nr:flagellar basal body L-ring protein FlgH [Parendozoicomonas haliclonae]SMA49656.1 Flagellar L-ring protein precursor [Parendozoicomonas haliclonae]